MLYITQLIYINPGKEDTFHQFEDAVLPFLDKYGGKIELRLRPDRSAFIEGVMEAPYEVHLVSFATQEGMDGYMAAEERKKYLHLKDASVSKVFMVKGWN